MFFSQSCFFFFSSVLLALVVFLKKSLGCFSCTSAIAHVGVTSFSHCWCFPLALVLPFLHLHCYFFRVGHVALLVFFCCSSHINVDNFLTQVFNSFCVGPCPYHTNVALLMLVLPFSCWCCHSSHVCVVILLAFML